MRQHFLYGTNIGKGDIMDIYISHLVEDREILEILGQYEVGMEIIHFSIAEVLDNVETEIKQYEARMESVLKQRNIGLHGPFFDLSPASFDTCIKAVTMKRFETAYEVAKRIGAKHIVFHTGFIPITYYIEGWLGNSIKFWKEFMADKDESIQIYLENVYEEEYWPIVKVIDEVNHQAFKACLDVGHVNAYSTQSVERWIQGLGHRIGHVHIHNNDGTKDMHNELNEGTIEMKSTIKAIREVSPKARYTIEIADQEKIARSIQCLYGYTQA